MVRHRLDPVLVQEQLLEILTVRQLRGESGQLVEAEVDFHQAVVRAVDRQGQGRVRLVVQLQDVLILGVLLAVQHAIVEAARQRVLSLLVRRESLRQVREQRAVLRVRTHRSGVRELHRNYLN